jgi:hypothetical protein
LDHRLGLAVIDMEQIPRDRKARAEEATRQRIEQEAAERLRRMEREAIERQQRIEAEAAERLRREQEIQRKHEEMLIKQSVPEAVRDITFLEWLSWAERYAEEVDPFSIPLSIAKPTISGACSGEQRHSPSNIVR